MAPWTVVARSFRPAPRIPGIASDAPPPPRSRDTHSREDLGSPAPAHRAPGASGDHIRGTQTPCEQACAAPTASASSPLRPVRADTPGTPATTESQSILCASTAECTQKSHLTESSTFEGFPEFLRRAGNLMVANDLAELTLGNQQPGAHPALDLIAGPPTLYPAVGILHRRDGQRDIQLRAIHPGLPHGGKLDRVLANLYPNLTACICCALVCRTLRRSSSGFPSRTPQLIPAVSDDGALTASAVCTMRGSI